MPLLLPGDAVTALPTPSKPGATLKLGPGLTHIPPSEVSAHKAGQLIVDARKNALWIESNSRRYIPSPQDAVIATILRSSADSYICAISSSTSPAPSSVQATLPHLAFPNATKKTRPILQPGSTVYARVSLANKHMDPELECFDAETGKASGFGELKGGMVFSVSLGLARRLLGDGKKMRQVARRAGEEWEGGHGAEVLEELGKSLAFECAVGRNGKVWIDSEDVKTTLLVGRCIIASETMTADEVRELVRVELAQG
ncbi:hypothetical protein FN846DRAFT_908269 [Sphaerosporella brunnea]|uniref:Ribosomal RNA-processing protein 40 n=1 Tax=Sphaerosporella brunnea TaxID=1250544 RepID=A0A5J5ET51_9PEZI|nr:hypothetical protein FN846DRAFT_908269 [Sphaerosporella brunnea]